MSKAETPKPASRVELHLIWFSTSIGVYAGPSKAEALVAANAVFNTIHGLDRGGYLSRASMSWCISIDGEFVSTDLDDLRRETPSEDAALADGENPTDPGEGYRFLEEDEYPDCREGDQLWACYPHGFFEWIPVKQEGVLPVSAGKSFNLVYRRPVKPEPKKQTIWKYNLQVTEEHILQIPEGSQILSLQLQGTQPVLWVLVDESRLPLKRRMYTYSVGKQLTPPPAGQTYVGTYQLSPTMAYHVFIGPEGVD
jgi:hypothetical protein